MASQPFSGLQRLLNGPAKDIRNMAEALRVLPDLAAILAKIRDETVELNAEVKLMRQSVNRIEGEIGELRGVLSPWQRTRARFGRAGRDGTAEGDDA